MSEHIATAHVHRDDVASKMGMWIFLFTELLLFGGLFIVYAVYRHSYFEQFHTAALELNTFIGCINTVMLLLSSATVAMSITAIQRGQKNRALMLLAFTILCGFVFLVNKYFEWSGKVHHNIYPGSEFIMSIDHGYTLFFGLYYVMTGLHGLHILVGMILLAVIYVKVKNGRIHSTDYVLLENGGLYWHLVDLIWIYLFPLFYIIT